MSLSASEPDTLGMATSSCSSHHDGCLVDGLEGAYLVRAGGQPPGGRSCRAGPEGEQLAEDLAQGRPEVDGVVG